MRLHILLMCWNCKSIDSKLFESVIFWRRPTETRSKAWKARVGFKRHKAPALRVIQAETRLAVYRLFVVTRRAGALALLEE